MWNSRGYLSCSRIDEAPLNNFLSCRARNERMNFGVADLDFAVFPLLSITFLVINIISKQL